MYCQKCGVSVKDTANFCQNCGSKIEKIKICSSCGTQLNENDIFCSQCGTKCSSQPTSKQESTHTSISYSTINTAAPNVPSNASNGNIEPHQDVFKVFLSTFPNIAAIGGKEFHVAGTMDLDDSKIKALYTLVLKTAKISNAEKIIAFLDTLNEGQNKGVYQEGFILTTEGLRLGLPYRNWNLIPYRSIKKMKYGKSGLANIMEITLDDFSTLKCYLTGIQQPQEFVRYFSNFVKKLNRSENCQNSLDFHTIMTTVCGAKHPSTVSFGSGSPVASMAHPPIKYGVKLKV